VVIAGNFNVNTRIFTFFCFGVMIFFVLLVIGGSLIQGKLDKKKERRRADLERLS